MKKISGIVSLFGTAALLLGSCTPLSTVKKPVIETITEKPITIVHGDTLVYQIAFSDKPERERFIYSFDRFLKENSFFAERFDSAGVLTVMRILPGAQSGELFPAAGDTGVTAFFDTVSIGDVVQEQSDEARPPPGGSLRIYSPRSVIDYPLSELTEAYPLAERIGDDSIAGYFRVVTVSPTSISLEFQNKVTVGGKTVTSLDIIDGWTRYLRERPGEGRALFASCQGIDEFTGGREAVVRGFTAVDNKTIRIKLSRPDPDALDRLRTRRALPALLGLGKYRVKVSRESETVLAPNNDAPGDKPFVNEALVRRGSDPNPMLAFSLGRYDAMLIWSAADLDYARRNLLKNGTCTLVGRDRYFLALHLDDPGARAAVRSSISIAELLNRYVKAEGRVIASVESDSALAAPPGATVKSAPEEPLAVYYLKDDPISQIIAERLIASANQAGFKANLYPSDRRLFESALVGKSRGCFVGWAPQSVLTEKSEKLRLASLFFDRNADEAARIGSNYEIPLFSVDWYLLAREKVGLYKGKIGGIYVKQEHW
jgi:hypothetical protein